jgi:hypothetical protein
MGVTRFAIASVLAVAFIAGSGTSAAADRPVRILIDGRPVVRMAALAHGGRIYVDLVGMVRAFSGLAIFEKSTATVSIGDRVAVFTLGSSRANLDGDVIATGGKAFESNGDFYVPLNFIATAVAHARVRIGGNGSLAMITSQGMH